MGSRVDFKGRSLMVLLSMVGLVAMVGAGTALGGHGKGKGKGKPDKFRAALQPIPHDPAADAGSNAIGRAKARLRGDTDLKIRIKVRNVTPKLPHAMHIHAVEEGEVGVCPGADRRDDKVDDGLIETLEGVEDYGGVAVSFTERGDTSADSGLALERFPVAKRNGKLVYKRAFEIPEDIGSRLEQLHIVVHGHDLDGDGAYGGRVTDLGAPLEAELPVACGQIDVK